MCKKHDVGTSLVIFLMIVNFVQNDRTDISKIGGKTYGDLFRSKNWSRVKNNHTEKIFSEEKQIRTTRDVSSPKSKCGGRLVSKNGFLSTPKFPAEFSTPLNCEWVISTDEIGDAEKITVYMTQLYVFTGLVSKIIIIINNRSILILYFLLQVFTEYGYYDKEYKMGGRKVHEVTEENVTKVKWIEVR